MPRLSDIDDRFAPSVGMGSIAAKANEINDDDVFGDGGLVTVEATMANGKAAGCGVYVLLGIDGCVKIGWTLNVVKRKRQLQIGSSVPLVIAYFAPCDEPQRIERLVHCELKEFRVLGEWFQVSVETARAAISRAIRSTKPQIKYRMPTATPKIDGARLAILEFIENSMVEGEPTAFKALRYCYAKWREKNGWPELSDRTLSEAMQAVGCKRVQIDGRSRGKGRYIAFELPPREVLP